MDGLSNNDMKIFCAILLFCSVMEVVVITVLVEAVTVEMVAIAEVIQVEVSLIGACHIVFQVMETLLLTVTVYDTL